MAHHGWLKQLLLLLMMPKVTVDDFARTKTSLEILRTQLLMRLVLQMLLLLLESLIKLSLAYSFSNLSISGVSTTLIIMVVLLMRYILR